MADRIMSAAPSAPGSRLGDAEAAEQKDCRPPASTKALSCMHSSQQPRLASYRADRIPNVSPASGACIMQGDSDLITHGFVAFLVPTQPEVLNIR